MSFAEEYFAIKAKKKKKENEEKKKTENTKKAEASENIAPIMRPYDAIMQSRGVSFPIAPVASTIVLPSAPVKKAYEQQDTTSPYDFDADNIWQDDYLMRMSERQKDKTGKFAYSTPIANSPYSLPMDPNAVLNAQKNLNPAGVANANDIARNSNGGGTWFNMDHTKEFIKNGFDADAMEAATAATLADGVVNILEGGLTVAEGVVDLGMYGVYGISSLFGADEFAADVKEAAKLEAIAEASDWVQDNEFFNQSMLGEKSEGVAQGLGQVGAMYLTAGIGQAAGAGSAGTSALTTGVMAGSSFGSGMSEAYNAGASDGEAVAYGAMKGVIDAGTEMLFGGLGKSVKALGVGRGLSSLDDMFAKKLSSKLSSKAAQTLVQYGVKSAAEGFEEVLAGLGTAAAKKLTYMSDEELSQLIADENLLDQFVTGMVVSGIAQGGDVVSSVRSGRDFVTGLDANEEAVVNKVYEDRVANAEKEGKLTGKEKSMIYDDVVREMERGGIATDIIEEVLGGETYKSYRDTVDSEDAMKQEYDKLGAKTTPTLAETTRFNELHKQIGDLETTSQRNALKEQLGSEVMSLVKGSRLEESYNERSRRGQVFQADLSKYDAKQKAIVQKAIDSGILNNTNRTHEFVDLVARIAADKGVSFDFTNNERLKKSGFAVDGATINGYVTKDGVTLNIDSAKALNRVVGHEITHVLEGTELYGALQSAVTEYAKSTGEYQTRYDNLAKLYKNVKDADIDAELTADLVGDYLFTDADFVRNLSVQHRNVFRKIYDEIKYLCKVATAGSKEARMLEKVKKTFEDAYRADVTEAQTDTKYSLENGGKRKYNNRSRYSEAETLFLSWENGSAPVGEVKRFVRFGKVHYYEKTENGCVELSRKQYNERNGKHAEDIDRRAEREIGKTADYDGGSQRGTTGYPDSNRYTGGNASVFGQAVREELQNDTGRSTSGTLGYNRGNDISKSEYTEEASDESGASFTFSNDYATVRNFMKEGDETGQKSEDAKRKADIGTAKFSLSEAVESYAEITARRQELYQREANLEERRREATSNPELLQALDDYSNLASEMKQLFSKRRAGTATQADLDRIEEIKTAREETMKRVAEIQEALGLGAIEEERREIQETKETLRVAADAAWEREGAEKENKAIEKSGMAAPEYFRKKAIKSFKTTTNFNEAGYLLPDGKMLNFSGGERNHRYRDHREIGEIYEATNGVNALNRFLSDGNIRVMAESPGIDLASGVEPTMEQYQAIRRFVNSHGTKDGRFFVDFSATDGHRMGNYSYEGRVNADRVLNDIKYYYANGETREQSGIGRFLSLSDVDETPDNHGLAPLNKFRHGSDVFGKDISLEAAPVRETVAENATVAPVGETVSKMETVADAEPAPVAGEGAATGDVAPAMKSAARDVSGEAAAEAPAAEKRLRKQYHQSIVDGVKEEFEKNGLDFDGVLKKAKNLSTFATVDNTPQRVMEKALGYKEGQILSDLTVNKAAQNETEGIKWLNSYTDRKNGLLKQISKQYHIKPGSKESAAAQMYAEGFYVDDDNNIVSYGDTELAKDFPDINVQRNIKRLARDPRIRKIYDETLDMINESRTRNAYPEIQKLDNYFLHFRAMDDTFSRLGLPFNPNDIRAKDLPTDLNGVTADLKPGQPYFASAMHRTGKRTSFDLLGGLERYLTSAKNQIFHIDDIQTLRALRNYIADTYGQANGLEGLDSLSEEEAQERIEKVYNSHLSTFAKFLNEEANIFAGKTALIDRGLEGILGRRGMTFLDTVNKQVGSNMVGWNLSSSLTNILPVAQTFAKTNKFDFVKAFAQTVGNRVGSVFGRTDGFAERSPVMIRREGADRFYRTPWQKAGDAGYVFMSAIDSISTELIARTKYNEYIRKGMDADKAHYETDKWVSRLMGDRSLGQMPQLYNSKMLGLVTKFQLEVRNQLDSQFYDTIQETKVSNEHIKNGLARNAKTAAKVASTFVQLAVVQHLFGKAFESVAGYNPAFDIIEVLMTVFGFDDEEDSEDTVLDNIEQGFLALLEDLPYTSTFTGGRIPISTALPVEELVTGKDEWGNEKPRLETLGEIAPYYVLPGGYGQIKKTYQGLSMFSDDHPVAGSYTDKGDLRFPVDDTLGSRVQAGIFGQWASENARSYFDNNLAPLDEKHIQEYTALNLSFDDYWAYRDDVTAISKRANAEGASDEDVLKYKYLNSVNDELSDILAEKKKVLADDKLSETEKARRIGELDERFADLANERYNSYNNVSFDGDYAHIGSRYFQWYTPEEGEPYWRKLTEEQKTKYLVTSAAGDALYADDGENYYRWYKPDGKEASWHKLTDDQVTKYLATRDADGIYATNGTEHYRLNEGGDPDNISDWTKLSEKEVKRMNEVTKELGITPDEYWSKTEKSMFPMYEGEYEYAYDYPENYAVAKAVGGYEAYKGYSGALSNIKSDKDKYGNTIKDSRKEKVWDYISGLDTDNYTKMILWKSEYPSDDTYNYEIIDYLNGRDDISFAEMVAILRKIGFDVTDDGEISW